VAAKSDQKRRRPVIDTSAQDSNGNYVDQIALDSVNYESQAQSVIDPSDNYPASFFTGIKLNPLMFVMFLSLQLFCRQFTSF
jgi:hypothetical protein